MARILAQTKNYKILSEYHTVWLERPHYKPAIIIDDFFADPKAAIIDCKERWCVIVGFGLIIYYLHEPFQLYEYNKQTEQWDEFFRDPRNIRNIWIIEDVYQTEDDAIRFEVGSGRENQGSYEFSMKDFSLRKITGDGEKIVDIVFSKDGTLLLHSFNEKVDVWDLKNNLLRYQVPGALLGVSHNHNSFQTTVGVWNIDTGDEIESPLALHDWDKRLNVSGCAIKNKYYLEVTDRTGIREPQLIEVGGKIGIAIVWDRVDRNGHYVAVFFSINIAGHDLDQTVCYDLETGQDVYSFTDDYDVSFSGVHNLLVAKNKVKSSLTVCDLSTKQKLELEKVGQVDEHTVRINPKNVEFVATINKKRNMIFLGQINRVSQRRMIKTGQRVLDIDFSPDGTRIAASLSDGDVYIWDVNSYQLIQRLVAN